MPHKWKPPKWDYQRRAMECIAQGSLTNSKRPSCLIEGIYPTHLATGHGAYVWDVEGNRFLDFICGLGSNILGYGHPEVTEAIIHRAHQGATLSLSSYTELFTAEKVKELVPWVEQVKFLKTGSEACQAALRIARAYTKRNRVYTEGYHGWSDEFVSLTPPALGVMHHQWIRKLEAAEIEPDTAAVIIEPVMLDTSDDRIAWLRQLREFCTRNGVVLIFDEIITGFRYPGFTVAQHYGIQPDLICLGKAIANGMPLSAVAGKRDLMSGQEYFVSSTFAGETLSLAAATKTMQLLQTKYRLEHLWEKGGQFLKAFNSIWPGMIQIEGYPTRGYFKGDPEVKAKFWQEACRAGILFGPSWFFNFHHISVMDQVLNTCSDILTRIRTGSVQLEGKAPQSPFAAKVREGKA